MVTLSQDATDLIITLEPPYDPSYVDASYRMYLSVTLLDYPDVAAAVTIFDFDVTAACALTGMMIHASYINWDWQALVYNLGDPPLQATFYT